MGQSQENERGGSRNLALDGLIGGREHSRACVLAYLIGGQEGRSIGIIKKMKKENATQIPVYLEVGEKRTFACALEWPGWCRSSHDEHSALQVLLDYGAKYATILHAVRIELQIPREASTFKVIERLKGNASTDFGAPYATPAYDLSHVDEAELGRFQAMLMAYWQAFDAAVLAAQGKELRKGPRGGGRDLKKIVWHVLEGETAYLNMLGWKHKLLEGGDPREELQRSRAAVLEGLSHAVHGELPESGPRGGKRWKPRKFMRRAAWHVLDHAWEIEERVV